MSHIHHLLSVGSYNRGGHVLFSVLLSKHVFGVHNRIKWIQISVQFAAYTDFAHSLSD